MRMGIVDNIHLSRVVQTVPRKIAEQLLQSWETMDREVQQIGLRQSAEDSQVQLSAEEDC